MSRNTRPYSKHNKSKKGLRGIVQVVHTAPSKHEALSSRPIPPKINKFERLIQSLRFQQKLPFFICTECKCECLELVNYNSALAKASVLMPSK
jgi:hypothetical protein